MKKYLLSTILFIAGLQFSYAQCPNPVPGFGVGITCPEEKLDVDGAIKIGTTTRTNAGTIRWTGADFEGYNGSQWSSLTSGGVSNDNLGNHTATQNIALNGQYLSGDGDAEGITIDANGDVGIGHTNAQHKLSIGEAHSDIQLITLRGYSNSGAWKGGAAFGYTNASVIFGELQNVAQIGGHTSNLSGWADLLINSGGGNVGIGTGGNAPLAKLDVNGNISLNNQTLWLRAGNDPFHGLVYGGFGNGTTWGGYPIDGPALFGSQSGALGTTTGGQNIALSWKTDGDINVPGKISIGTNPLQNVDYPLEVHTSTNYGVNNIHTIFPDWNDGSGFAFYGHTVVVNPGCPPNQQVPGGCIGTISGATNAPADFGIMCNQRIGALEFDAFSDRREKNIIGRSNSVEDLERLMQVKITDYTWIDAPSKGTVPEKKVIAQELREVYPEAINLIVKAIPDVYSFPQAIEVDKENRTVKLTLDKKTEIAAGELIRYHIGSEVGFATVLVADSESKTYTLQFKEKGQLPIQPWDLFVYGRKVNDYHSVDYDALFALNVSATQQIYKELMEEKAKGAALKNQLNQLQADNRIRLERIEALLGIVMEANK